MKKDSPTTKERNWYLYHKLYNMNSSHTLRVNNIFNKWNLPIEEDFSNIKDYIKEFENKNGENSIKRLTKDVFKLINDSDLGSNWFIPYLFFFLTEKEEPIPNNSFSIKKGYKRLSIEIYPHTDLEDIKKNWKEIENLKKEVWPSTRKIKITKKSIENLLIFMEQFHIKNNFKIEKFKDDIKDKPKERKTRTNDYDVIDKIWGDEDINIDIKQTFKNEEKKVNKLKQIRKRGIIGNRCQKRITFSQRNWPATDLQ